MWSKHPIFKNKNEQTATTIRRQNVQQAGKWMPQQMKVF